MDGFEQISGIIALTMGVAWASGINLYAAMLILGLMGLNGTVQLPPDLQLFLLAAIWLFPRIWQKCKYLFLRLIKPTDRSRYQPPSKYLIVSR